MVLLVDGHTTHIDLEISQFCKENGILLYCLLAHSSHITQPLDVSFFGALKNSWAKAVDKYKISHMGSSVTKESFALVFCTVWTGVVKMATIVNSFARSGIYPIDRSAVGNPGPATLYSESTTDSSSASPTSCGLVASESSTIEALSLLVAIENVMDPSTVKRFHRHYNEGCEVNGDELYTVWEQLNKLTLSSQSSGEGENSALTQTSAPLLQSKASTTTQAVPVRQPVSEAFSDILVYPEPITKKSKKPRNPMPSHLNSSQMVECLSVKRQEKLDKEAEAQQRKVTREAKKAEKEKLKAEKEKLKAARLAKKATAQSLATTSKKNGKRRRERRKKSEQGESAKTMPTAAVVEEACFAESESSSTEDLEDSLNACPVCCGTTNGDWVACDNCSQWYHIVCAGIAQDLDEVESLEWYCSKCSA